MRERQNELMGRSESLERICLASLRGTLNLPSKSLAEPLPSEYGTYKAVKAIFWLWREPPFELKVCKT